jgi:hypothetical protein
VSEKRDETGKEGGEGDEGGALVASKVDLAIKNATETLTVDFEEPGFSSRALNIYYSAERRTTQHVTPQQSRTMTEVARQQYAIPAEQQTARSKQGTYRILVLSIFGAAAIGSVMMAPATAGFVVLIVAAIAGGNLVREFLDGVKKKTKD